MSLFTVCVSECKADCETCFTRNFCTKCKSGFYLYSGKCLEKCPDGLEANNHTMECTSIGKSSPLRVLPGFPGDLSRAGVDRSVKHHLNWKHSALPKLFPSTNSSYFPSLLLHKSQKLICAPQPQPWPQGLFCLQRRVRLLRPEVE